MDPTLTVIQAAAVVGVVEIAKAHGLSTKYAAIASPFIGALILALYAVIPSADVGVLNAIVTGLAATGGYGALSAMSATVTTTVAPSAPLQTSVSSPTP